MRHTSVLILTATHTTRQVPLILIFMSKKYLSPRALLRVRFIHRITSQPPLILLVAMRHPPLRLLISALDASLRRGWLQSAMATAPRHDDDGSNDLVLLHIISGVVRGVPQCRSPFLSLSIHENSFSLLFMQQHTRAHDCGLPPRWCTHYKKYHKNLWYFWVTF
jgi:hypothetical protein